jgi:hypothetical protein
LIPVVTSVVPAARANQPLPTVPTPNAAAPAKAPGSASVATTPSSTVAQPSVQDVQKIITGITTQVTNSATTGTPLTKEQVEAQVRDLLKQLGINY